MALLELSSETITSNGNKVYIIAEIGQNHQGNIELAKQMIVEAKKIGCDCVKFQKSCLEAKYTKSALNRVYDGKHSWGATYGEHKMHLELSGVQYVELSNFCQKYHIDFAVSAMDEVTLQYLDELHGLTFIKIGSGDANNFPLLERASKLSKPLIISTGMQTMFTVEKIVRIMKNNKKTNFALLHCVSSYPTIPKDCTLGIISILKKKFPNVLIGYSGHELGIDISKVAILLGARIIERHFTLDHNQKGSDHICSLEPKDMKRLVNYVKSAKQFSQCNENNILQNLPPSSDRKSLLEALLPVDNKKVLPCEMKCRDKLGKSLVAAKNLTTGTVLSREDICVKVSEPSGISAEYYYQIIGAFIYHDVPKDYPILWYYIRNI